MTDFVSPAEKQSIIDIIRETPNASAQELVLLLSIEIDVSLGMIILVAEQENFKVRTDARDREFDDTIKAYLIGREIISAQVRVSPAPTAVIKDVPETFEVLKEKLNAPIKKRAKTPGKSETIKKNFTDLVKLNAALFARSTQHYDNWVRAGFSLTTFEQYCGVVRAFYEGNTVERAAALNETTQTVAQKIRQIEGLEKVRQELKRRARLQTKDS